MTDDLMPSAKEGIACDRRTYVPSRAKGPAHLIEL